MKKILFLLWVICISDTFACMREKVENGDEGTLHLHLLFASQNEDNITYKNAYGTANLISGEDADFNKRVCLTAAHCLIDKDTNFKLILDKSYALYKEEVKLNIIGYFCHEDYKNDISIDTPYDIALLLLEHPIFANNVPYIDPFYTPKDNERINGSLCGFGMIDEAGNGHEWKANTTNYRKKLIVSSEKAEKGTLAAYYPHPDAKAVDRLSLPDWYRSLSGWYSLSHTTGGDSGGVFVDSLQRIQGVLSGGKIHFYNHPAFQKYYYCTVSSILGSFIFGNYKIYNTSWNFIQKSLSYLTFNYGLIVIFNRIHDWAHSIHDNIDKKINGKEIAPNWAYRFFNHFHKIEEGRWLRQSTFCSIHPHLEWIQSKTPYVHNTITTPIKADEEAGVDYDNPLLWPSNNIPENKIAPLPEKSHFFNVTINQPKVDITTPHTIDNLTLSPFSTLSLETAQNLKVWGGVTVKPNASLIIKDTTVQTESNFYFNYLMIEHEAKFQTPSHLIIPPQKQLVVEGILEAWSMTIHKAASLKGSGHLKVGSFRNAGTLITEKRDNTYLRGGIETTNSYFIQQKDSKMKINLSPTSLDEPYFFIHGTFMANDKSTLELSLEAAFDSYQPGEYVLVRATKIEGEFTNIIFPSFPQGAKGEIMYTSNAISLKLLLPPTNH